MAQGDTMFYDGGDDRYLNMEGGPHPREWRMSDLNYVMIGMMGSAAGMELREVSNLAQWWKEEGKRSEPEDYRNDTNIMVTIGYEYYEQFSRKVGPFLPKVGLQSFGRWYEKAHQ